MLEGLVTAITLIEHRWRPISCYRVERVRHLGGWCLQERQATPSDFLGNLVFVDAAKDVRRYRVGGVLPFLHAVRTWLCPEGPCNQQVAELMGIAWAIRLAVHLGWKTVTIFANSLVGISQTVRLRAASYLKTQLRVLRALTWVLHNSGLIAKLIWVPSILHPADPMSRVDADFEGSLFRAEEDAWNRWYVIQRYPDLCWVQGLAYV